MRARVMRMLASNAFESPAGTTLLGISAASGSVGGFSHARPRHCRHTRHCRFRRRCSRRQRLPAARCTARCSGPVLALCMDRASGTLACGGVLCVCGWC